MVCGTHALCERFLQKAEDVEEDFSCAHHQCIKCKGKSVYRCEACPYAYCAKHLPAEAKKLSKSEVR